MAGTLAAWACCDLDRQGHQQVQEAEALDLSAEEVAFVLHRPSSLAASGPVLAGEAAGESGLADFDASLVRGCGMTRPWGILGVAVDALPSHYYGSPVQDTPLGR